MSDDAVPGPSLISRPTVPALGYVLAAAWLVVMSVWAFIPAPGAGLTAQEPYWVAAGIVAALVAVVPPLLLRQIPTTLRRQAMPYLLLAGVLAGISINKEFSEYYQLVMMNAVVLYVIGWMRLRARSPLVQFAALVTAVLWVVGQQVAEMLVIQIEGPIPGQGPPWREALSAAVQYLVTVVVPGCVPVLATAFVRFRASVPTPLPPSAAADGGRRGWNPTAVASLVLGIVGGGITAVVFGHLALSQNRRTTQRGSGLAAAALVLGYLVVVILAGAYMIADLIATTS
jgi:hypothetical protein